MIHYLNGTEDMVEAMKPGSVVVDLAAGTETATVWTNDLSLAYVHENSAYST